MVYVLLALAMLGAWLYCLFDVLGTAEDDMRLLPKFGWLLVVLLGFWVGAVMWVLFGRPRSAPARPSRPGRRRGGPDRPPPSPPRGPDDDPDFLRNLDRKIKGEDER